MTTNRNWVSLVITMLGAVKIVLDALGYHLISDTDWNNGVNYLAGLLAIVGVYLTHVKGGTAPATPVASTPVTPSTPATPVESTPSTPSK